jgi:hypothetical protein
MACRGTGRVISNLGGAPQDVTCPWCDGTGVRVPGIDAQARWPRERSVEPGADGEGETVQESPAPDGEEGPAGPSADGSDQVPPAA